MRALILKDLLCLRQQAKSVGLVLLVWLVLSVATSNGQFFCALGVVYIIMLPMMTLNFDEPVSYTHLIPPCCQRRIAQRRERHSAAVFDPVPALYRAHSLLRRAQLAFIFALKVHLHPPIFPPACRRAFLCILSHTPSPRASIDKA